MSVNRVRRSMVASLLLCLVVSLLAWSPAARPQSIRAAGPTPVAEWMFDEGTGLTASDAVGDLDGTLLGGASWVTSGAPQGAGAIAFDGVDDAVTVPTSAILEPTSFTLMFWVRSTDIRLTSNQPIVQKNFYGCDVGSSWSADQSSAGTNAQVYHAPYLYSTGPSTHHHVSMWDGAWHKFAMVVDGPSGAISAWVDGREQASSFGVPIALNYSSTGRLDSDLRIGGPGADCLYDKPFLGAIDDIQLFSSALTDAEVLAEMPVLPTTTTVRVVQHQVAATVFSDESFSLQAFFAPVPPSGDTSFYLSKDGGPETLFATRPMIENANWSYALVGPGVLAPGSYSYRATWLGTPNWLTSTSDPTTFTVVARPTEMTLGAVPDADVPGGGSTLTAKIRAIDPPASNVVAGSIEFHDVTGGGDVLLGTSALSYVGNPTWNQATFAVSGLATGSHTYEARFAATNSVGASSAQTTVTIGKQASGVSLDIAPNPVLSTTGATATAYMGTGRKGTTGISIPLPAATGTMTLKRVSNGAVLGTLPVVGGPGPYVFPLPVFPIGTVGIRAEYSGDVNFDASVSETFLLTVQADVVQATGVTTNYTSFYPYKDGYRDTVAIRGVRNEPASVSIRIYNSANRPVKAFSFASATGPYVASWTGRTSSGAILANGTYRVVQTLTDSGGMRLVVSRNVTLSGKRLYTYSTVLNLAGPTKRTTSWAAWQFTLPSAQVYKSLKVQIYGRSITIPGVSIGTQDVRRCAFTATYSPNCVATWIGMGYTTNWYTRVPSPTYNRSGRYVRAFAVANGTGAVSKARLYVTYALLK
jgi:hypothetical protein